MTCCQMMNAEILALRGHLRRLKEKNSDLMEKLTASDHVVREVDEKRARYREALELAVYALPALEGVKGYEKVIEPIIARADAALKGDTP